MTNKLKKLLLIPSLLIAFSGVAAEQTGAQISISSDRQTGKLKDGVGIFEGNVEIIHGNRRITAERLEAHGGDTEGTVELIIATGKPAYFEEKQADGTVMSASAEEVRYDVAKRFLTLNGEAEVTQAGQKVTAKSITYDMAQQLISAEKDENSTDRVHTILVPVDNKQDDKGQP